jgi:hypothetical protein
MSLEVRLGPIIEAGESLSSGLDCSGGTIMRITMPLVWTSANLSFQISTDGVDYNDLFNHTGGEIVVPVVPGTAVVLAPLGDYLKAFDYLRVRSGSRLWPVPQAERRQFAVAINLDAPGPKAEARPIQGE